MYLVFTSSSTTTSLDTAIKMATGSGKTKVMALTVAWQYFNAVAGGRDDYAKTFLVVAPNVIVFERLRCGFRRRTNLQTRPHRPSGATDLLGLRLLHARRPRAGQLAGCALSHEHPAVLYEAGTVDPDEPEAMTR